MARNFSKVLLLTANVGSIFEDPDKLLPIWLREFLSTVTNLEPDFLAIHCQEVGGKNYEESMQHVNKFIKMLLASEEMRPYDRARVFLDEDFTAVEKFTALGSLYFIHHTVKIVEIFDFHDKKFVPVEGKEVLSGNIEHVRIKEKAKFAKDFFPDSVWSRKGFIRTRWNIYHAVFDLVNIHLFHDVSNIAAMETSPSMYSLFRERALLHTVERFETDDYDKVPFFMFGDFNFRLDTNQLVQQLTAQAEEQRVSGKKNDISKVIFRQKDNGKVVLTVGKKDFHHCNHNDMFSSHNAMKLRMYDQEPEASRGKLFEYDVTFPPSYPFSEDAEDGTSYMPTRCPGWCDRVMMSHSAVGLMLLDNKSPDYKMIGAHICMGDHKPIYLNLKIRHRAGNEQDIEESLGDELRPGEPEFLPVKQVISINGEEVEASSLDQINIHDFMTFEQEVFLGNDFIDTIKKRKGCGAPKAGKSFKSVARSVLHSEKFIEAIKRRYAHRSDSEPDSEEDEKPTAASLSLIPKGTSDSIELGVLRPPVDVTDINTNANNSVVESRSDGVPASGSFTKDVPQGNGVSESETLLPSTDGATRAAPSTDRKPRPHPNASSVSARGCGCCRVQ